MTDTSREGGQKIRLVLGDCVEKMQDIPEGTIGAIVTDPPYGLSFMNKDFDTFRIVRRDFEALPNEWVTECQQDKGVLSAPPEGSGSIKLLVFQGVPIKPGNWQQMVTAQLAGQSVPEADYPDQANWDTLWGVGTGEGSTNPTCGECGGQLRGTNRCTCIDPVWMVDGEVVENSGSPGTTLQQKRLFQAWCVTWLKECYRVLRPGGTIKLFGSTRMYSRMAAAMEEVGFVLDPATSLEGWCYACLPEDTEVLTPEGWVLGVTVKQGDPVACWDPQTGTISMSLVTGTFQGPWDGDLVRFAHQDTDQLVTPNHRVWHWPRIRKMTEGKRVAHYDETCRVDEARNINRWNNLLLPASGIQSGPGIGGPAYAALLGWFWSEGGFDHTGSGVRISQSETANHQYVQEIDTLLASLGIPHKRYVRNRVWTYKGTSRDYCEVLWFISREWAQQVRRDLPEKHLSWALIWQMTVEEKHAFLQAVIKGDGNGKDRVYQKSYTELEKVQGLALLMGHRSKIGIRKSQPEKDKVLYLFCKAHVELQRKHLQNKTEWYNGTVWCVQVPTGAFVARRKGLIFVTGNSGFPKSLNIWKKLDQVAGVTPKVVGWKQGVGGENLNDVVHGRDVRTTDDPGGRGLGAYGVGAKQVAIEIPVTEPVSPEAKMFNGYGTALKPAVEIILVGRKPD